MQKIKISVLIVLLSSLIIHSICANLSVVTEESTNERFYRQGVEFAKQADYQNAYWNLNKISMGSKLAPASLYRQALCAERLEDWDLASKKYSKLIKRFPKSIFTPKGKYNLAQIYYKQDDLKKSESLFLDIKEHYPETNFAIAADYYLGLIYKSSNPMESKKHWLSYMALSPTGRYAVSCADELIKTNLLDEQNDYFHIAKVYFYNNNYENTLRFLQKVPIEKSWYYRGKSYQKLRNYSQAVLLFESGIVHNSKTTEQKLVQDAVDAYIELYSADKKYNMRRLQSLINKKNSNIYDYVLYRLAKNVSGEEKYKLYYEIAQKYPKGNYASEAVWWLFWKEFKAKNYATAQKIGKHHIQQYKNTQASARVLFWMAKVSELVKKQGEAKMYYTRILEKYPDDYYAFRAYSILHSDSDPNQGWKTNPQNRLPENDIKISPSTDYTGIHKSNIKMLHILARLGDFAILDGLDIENKLFQSWIDYNQARYSTSAIIARKGLEEMKEKPPFTDDIYKIAYPLHYTQKINSYSRVLNLDPYLIISIAREESYFDPRAKSGAGAMGLMQLMPVTAHYISSKYKIPLSSTGNLLDPKTNLKFGCAYFNYTKIKLNNNDMLAIAAYNGGPSAVQKWQEKLEYKDYDEFIENIPYEETQNYIKKVFRSYWNYLNIYSGKKSFL